MYSKGLTLLEMVVVLAIGSLLVTLVYSAFAGVGSVQGLDGSTQMVASTLRQARALTLSSSGDTQYGVHLESGRVVLFQGPTYNSSSPSNVATSLNSKVQISNVTLYGGGSDVVFNRLSGDTASYGTTTFSLVASTTLERKVIVYPTGTIETQ